MRGAGLGSGDSRVRVGWATFCHGANPAVMGGGEVIPAVTGGGVRPHATSASRATQLPRGGHTPPPCMAGCSVFAPPYMVAGPNGLDLQILCKPA